ncbi:hypothetical protein NT6N_30570 [Oceaniferula spumae]|uniref:Biopolymer transporter ExbD n=1 Tax=Oceaniferula spumae TaxID=2979115 RepID=A0AAT9FPG1_9BACT
MSDDEILMHEIDTQLPVADFSHSSPCSAANRVFVTLSGPNFRINNGFETDDMEKLYSGLSEKRSETKQNEFPLIYLIAPAETTFDQIRSAIRTAAKAGFADIFLVTKRTPASGNYLKHGLLLRLPTASGLSPPSIEPIFVRSDRDGSIFINTGPSQEALDHCREKRSLPKLNETLDNYAACARAGGFEPIAQIHIDSSATYQRAIDVMNAMQRCHIRHITFTDVTSTPHRTCQGMGKGKPGTPTQSPSAIPRPPQIVNPVKR